MEREQAQEQKESRETLNFVLSLSEELPMRKRKLYAGRVFQKVRNSVWETRHRDREGERALENTQSTERICGLGSIGLPITHNHGRKFLLLPVCLPTGTYKVVASSHIYMP